MRYAVHVEFTLEALGQVIRERREEKRLTQDELGTAAGYQAGAGVSVSRIEGGLTRPGKDRFPGIASALGLTQGQLETEAANRTTELARARGQSTLGRIGEERLKDRVKRIQQEIEHRTAVITELGEAFNQAHDRARDGFLMRFVQIAREIAGAPQPNPERLQDDEMTGAKAEAASRLRFTSYGVAHVLAGSAGGAVAGAAVGGAAAYATFMTDVSLGTASTGAAIGGLSGAAATNAALALLGGGTLAAGGAGVAGGMMLLTGIVAAPALLLAVGGLVWMVKRNRKQRQELVARLNVADAEIAATNRSFEALVDILPRATETLNYIALHATHALERWEVQLGNLPLDWTSLGPEEQKRYEDFVDISASQLNVVAINVQELMASRGKKRDRLVELADEVLSQSQAVAESLV